MDHLSSLASIAVPLAMGEQHQAPERNGVEAGVFGGTLEGDSKEVHTPTQSPRASDSRPCSGMPGSLDLSGMFALARAADLADDTIARVEDESEDEDQSEEDENDMGDQTWTNDDGGDDVDNEDKEQEMKGGDNAALLPTQEHLKMNMEDGTNAEPTQEHLEMDMEDDDDAEPIQETLEKDEDLSSMVKQAAMEFEELPRSFFFLQEEEEEKAWNMREVDMRPSRPSVFEEDSMDDIEGDI